MDKKTKKSMPKTLPAKNPLKTKILSPTPSWFIDSKITEGWQAFIYSLPKDGKEHDGWSFRKNNAVVSDGATPLSEEWGKDLYHWVNTLSSLFAENAKNLEKPLIDIWHDSINFVNGIFNPNSYKRTMGSSHLRFNGDIIETLTVGDTKVVFEKTDGSFLEVFDNRLTKWEQRADALIYDGHLTGEMAAWHNRMKANQLDGYYVVSDEPKVGQHAVYYKIDASKIKSLIICTDGLWRIFEGEPELMFNTIKHSNAENLNNEINNVGTINDDLTFIRLDNLNYQP